MTVGKPAGLPEYCRMRLAATVLGSAVALATAMGASAGTEAIDRLEPGLQGQAIAKDRPGSVLDRPYASGVNLVGHAPVRDRGINVQLAWVDHCAYISGSGEAKPHLGGDEIDPVWSGVAVVDVRDPARPRTVGLLRDRGSLSSLEAIHAVDTAKRKVLVAGTYEKGATWLPPGQAEGWVSIYDASQCDAPVLTAEYQLPEKIHTLTLSANGLRLYATSLSPFTGHGGIHVLDISDMANPRYLGKFGATTSDGSSFEFAPHEISLSGDERRIFAGVIASRGDDLNPGIVLYPPSAEGLGNDAGGIYILDNSHIAAGHPAPAIRLISTVPHGGWHSVMPASIDGVPHLVAGAELGICPATWPKIINIANEVAPVMAGEFRLAMNRAENCPPPTTAENASRIAGRPGTASLHYNDVDSATATRLGLFQFMWAGLRIIDLKNPGKPQEVAYFKPGDPCGGHVRYVPASGHIWLTCSRSGFHVIELQPELRRSLGLPAVTN